MADPFEPSDISDDAPAPTEAKNISWREVWAEITRHKGWYLLIFLLSGLPVFIATLWGPVMGSKTIPDWLVENRWPRLQIFVLGWIGVACLITLVIITRSYLAVKNRETLENRAVTALAPYFSELTHEERTVMRLIVALGRSLQTVTDKQKRSLEAIAEKTPFVTRKSGGHYELKKEHEPALMKLFSTTRVDKNAYIRIEYENANLRREVVYNRFAGTTDEHNPLKGFAIYIDPPVTGLGLEYMAHIQYVGDTEYKPEGTFLMSGHGTDYWERRYNIEGFAVRLTGSQAPYYDVVYSACLARSGNTERIYKNGEFCGTRGQFRALEGIAVRIVPRGTTPLYLIGG